jgi:hypothetical protein
MVAARIFFLSALELEIHLGESLPPWTTSVSILYWTLGGLTFIIIRHGIVTLSFKMRAIMLDLTRIARVVRSPRVKAGTPAVSLSCFYAMKIDTVLSPYSINYFRRHVSGFRFRPQCKETKKFTAGDEVWEVEPEISIDGFRNFVKVACSVNCDNLFGHFAFCLEMPPKSAYEFCAERKFIWWIKLLRG